MARNPFNRQRKSPFAPSGIIAPLSFCAACCFPLPVGAQLLTGNWDIPTPVQQEALLVAEQNRAQEELARAVREENLVPEHKPEQTLREENFSQEGQRARNFEEIIAQPVSLTSPEQKPAPIKLKPPPMERKGAARKEEDADELAQEPVDLQADELSYDEEGQVVVARGNVVLKQAGRILKAEEIRYRLAEDRVVATGNVSLTDVNGDVHLAEQVEFQDQLKNGFVNGLRSFLLDGSRFSAEKGERYNATKTIMRDARYTPCQACSAADLDEEPLWQIRAAKVTHNELEHRISYNHARFEVYGVPVAYTPYFSHPDGTIDRKSGFLAPSFGYKSDLGAFMENEFYWAIAPDMDATMGLTYFTDVDPLATAEWRQRWDNAEVKLSGGLTNSDRNDGDDRDDEDLRGHLLGEGLWDINNKWRAGFNLEHASDDRYMREYDFSSEDVLENEVYAERFSGRNYAVGRLLSFQDIRTSDAQQDQPDVLPEFIASFMGEPGDMPAIGGNWTLDTSFLGLQRAGDEQDVNRFSAMAGWHRRLISDYGLVTNIDTTLRGDFYNARDRDVAGFGSGRSRDTTEGRFFPQANVQASYPMVKASETYQTTIEPIVSLTAAPNIDVNDNIPNEDSQDVQVDASNIFEPNRFPGLDRVEDKSRVTYGMKTGAYGYDGSHLDLFLGQSYRLDDDDNPFPEGSGLSRQNSDFVGQVSSTYKDIYNLDYRFQLDSSSLASQRHEIDVSADWKKFYIGSRYLFAKALGGTAIDESREQASAGIGYYFTPEWRGRLGAVEDLGEDAGLREAYAGLDYFGQCMSWSVTAERNLTDESSGESSTEVIFRIGLKNLGEFETSDLRRSSTCD